MAFVHEQSCECTKSELDLFALPPTQTSMESGKWVEYHPLSSPEQGGPIEFLIAGSGEDYIDFANSSLVVSATIVQQDGATALAGDARCGPTNLWLHSLFSEVEIALNGTQITTSTNTYPYRAMLETLLTYGSDAKQTQLTQALYYKDEPERMDSTTRVAGTRNDGLLTRMELIRGSRTVDMMGRIHADIFFQDRYMLNEVDVKVKLLRSRHAFSTMSHVAAKTVIRKAMLLVRKVKLSPSVFLAHAKALENATAKYPIRRVVCKSFTVAGGLSDVSHEKLFAGQLPTRLVLGLVRNSAFNGHTAENPFNFQHFGVTEIAVYLDGQQTGIKPIALDYTNSLYVRAYNSLFAGTGKAHRDEGNQISRTDFKNGYALYAFDLTADLGDEEQFNLIKQGSVRVALKFNAALANAITVVAYAEFENLIEVDRNRNVIFDFGA